MNAADQWIEELIAARKAARRVREGNAPTVRWNQRARRANWWLRRKREAAKEAHPRRKIWRRLKLFEIRPAPLKLSDRHRKVMQRESRLKDQLIARRPEEWREQIERLQPWLRSSVARLVWWDYFGHRMSGERWDHLDDYINAPFGDQPDEWIRAGLETVGYSPWDAQQRATTRNTIEEGAAA